ncbi:hypothetical protein V9T40_014402 [Parthenolecanium corni]|uniref:Uncharacterized protein n=1 Tax=Parthenolecanium corni TaxID=536013 RepID=A0AAN9T6U0_9HEMI
MTPPGIFFIVCALLATVNSIIGEETCRQYKSRGYLTADCAEKRLSKLPSDLKSDTEVLDLSYNLIRELYNNTFSCCTSIQFLYLQGNAIYEVASHVFAPLSSLQVLDLNRNVLGEIPKNLPSSLQRLYIDENPPIFKNEPVLEISSLTSLTVLTSSSQKLQVFPRFDGVIPNLIELNVSNNAFKFITPQDLAPLCQLQFLRVSGEKLFTDREYQCDCLRFQKWVEDFKINVDTKVTCSTEKPEACILEHTNETLQIREKCLSELSARKLPYKLMIGSGIIAVILCIGILLYIRHRRRKRNKSKTVGGQNSRTPSVKYDNKTLEEK